MSLHFFVAEPDQPLFRIPIAVMEQLSNHKAALPAYAGKRVRVAEVSADDNENGAPREIIRLVGFYLEFDANGLLPPDIWDQWRETAFYKLVPEKHDEKVVQIDERKKRRELDEKHYWTPTRQEEDSIALAALAHPRATKKVESVKIRKPPGPKVSFESRSAFGSIEEAIRKVSFAVYELDEAELLGLQQLIEQQIEKIAEHREIWRGILADNVAALKLMEAKRTGAGDWIGVVEIMRWNEKGNEGVSIKSWKETHLTREAALEAAQRLAAEKAFLMEANTSLEARVISALEWFSEG